MPAPIDEEATSPPRSPAGTARTPRSLEDLLTASTHRDVEAFGALYDALASRIYGMTFRVLRDTHQSEEVTHEVFLQVWNSSTPFEPGRGSALGWILTVAHRRAVDRVRSRSADCRRTLAPTTPAAHAPPFDETPSAQAPSQTDRVRTAVAALTPGQQQALELAYFDGRTDREVAAMLQIPVGTAQSHIRDGLLGLRELLAVPVVKPA